MSSRCDKCRTEHFNIEIDTGRVMPVSLSSQPVHDGSEVPSDCLHLNQIREHVDPYHSPLQLPVAAEALLRTLISLRQLPHKPARTVHFDAACSQLTVHFNGSVQYVRRSA